MPLGERSPVVRRTGSLGLLGSQVLYQLRLLRRTPMAAFVTVVIPVMVLLAAGLLYRGTHLASRGGIAYAQFLTPAMLVFAVLTACYMNVITSTVVAREQGILKRIRSTPLPPSVYIAGRMASAGLSAVGGIVLVVLTGSEVYGFQIVWAAVPVVALNVFVAIVCFCALGFAVSAFVPTAEATLPVAWGSILPFCFISDVFQPIDAAPDWLRSIASFFPVRPFADNLELAFNPVAGSTSVQWGRLGVIAAWGVGAALVAVLRFRWQPSGGRAGALALRLSAGPAIDRLRSLIQHGHSAHRP